MRIGKYDRKEELYISSWVTGNNRLYYGDQDGATSGCSGYSSAFNFIANIFPVGVALQFVLHTIWHHTKREAMAICEATCVIAQRNSDS